MAGEVLCTTLYNDGNVRHLYGRTQGMRPLLALLEAGRAESVQWGAAAVVASFALTVMGQSLLATTPVLQQVFERMVSHTAAVVNELHAGLAGDDQRRWTDVAPPARLRRARLRSAAARAAVGLWGCACALTVPVAGTGAPVGVGRESTFDALNHMLHTLLAATRVPGLESTAYALTAALAHLSSSPAIGASLLLCHVDGVFDALLRCDITLVREGALAAIGLLLEHERMDWVTARNLHSAARQTPDLAAHHYAEYALSHRLQLLSLVHPVLDLLEGTAADDESTPHVQHAVAMILMHLAAVDAPRVEREVGTVIDLLDKGRAPMCSAAAALWALVQNEHNRTVACALGATEQLLRVVSLHAQSFSVARDANDELVKGLELALAALWTLTHDTRCWALKDDWTEPSDAGEEEEEPPLELEAAEEGHALAEGQLKGETEAAYWQRQMAIYEEQEARERMQRQIAAGTLDPAEALALAAKLGAASPAAPAAPGAEEKEEEEEEEEGPLEVAPYGMTFVGTARLRETLLQRAQVDDVLTLVRLVAIPRSAHCGRTHDNVKQLACGLIQTLVETAAAFEEAVVHHGVIGPHLLRNALADDATVRCPYVKVGMVSFSGDAR